MRPNRQVVFDESRRINPDNMAEQQAAEVQNVHNLQLIIRQMQEQYQRDIQELRQQITQPERLFQLTADQIINRFQSIKTFYGKEDYKLQEFLSAVDNVAALCNNNIPLLQHGLRIVYREKIQGDAKRSIQRLGETPSWEEVKTELKSQFRPRKSYKKLMDQCRNIRVNTLRELFSIIRKINFDLNELYEYDDNKPSNYNPENNDRNLVDIVKDMLIGSYRSFIRYGMTLNEVFNIFDDLDLLDELDTIHSSFRKNKDLKNYNYNRKEVNRNDNYRQTQNRSDNNRQIHNRNNNLYQNNFENSSKNFRNRNNRFYNTNTTNSFNNSGKFRTDSNHRENPISGRFRQRQTSYNFNNHNNNNRNNEYRSDSVEPMEIDNIERQDVNFSNQPRTRNSP